jgi:hypothetical protein
MIEIGDSENVQRDALLTRLIMVIGWIRSDDAEDRQDTVSPINN